MIKGLNVTVGAQELQTLCRARAAHHEERAATYARQIASMTADNIEPMNYTNGDPVRALKEKRDEHHNAAQEMTFYAEHLETGETYLLDRSDMQLLGITKGRY